MAYRRLFEREIENVMKSITVKRDGKNLFLSEFPIDPKTQKQLYPEVMAFKRQKQSPPASKFDVLVDLDGTLLTDMSLREARKVLFGDDTVIDSLRSTLHSYATKYGGKEFGFTYYLIGVHEIFRRYGWSVSKEDELVDRMIQKVRWNLVSVLEAIKEKHDCKIYVVTGNAKSFSSKLVERINSRNGILIDGVFGGTVEFDDQGYMEGYPQLVSNITLTVNIGSEGKEVRLVTKLDLLKASKSVSESTNEQIVITDSVIDLALIDSCFTVYIHDRQEHSSPDQAAGVKYGLYDLLVTPNDLTPIKELFV